MNAMEPHLDPICQCLLHKSGENVLFFRQDVDRYAIFSYSVNKSPELFVRWSIKELLRLKILIGVDPVSLI